MNRMLADIWRSELRYPQRMEHLDSYGALDGPGKARSGRSTGAASALGQGQKR